MGWMWWWGSEWDGGWCGLECDEVDVEGYWSWYVGLGRRKQTDRQCNKLTKTMPKTDKRRDKDRYTHGHPDRQRQGEETRKAHTQKTDSKERKKRAFLAVS